MARARAPECWVNPLIALQGPFGAARSYLRTMPSHLSIMQSPQRLRGQIATGRDVGIVHFSRKWKDWPQAVVEVLTSSPWSGAVAIPTRYPAAPSRRAIAESAGVCGAARAADDGAALVGPSQWGTRWEAARETRKRQRNRGRMAERVSASPVAARGTLDRSPAFRSLRPGDCLLFTPCMLLPGSREGGSGVCTHGAALLRRVHGSQHGCDTTCCASGWRNKPSERRTQSPRSPLRPRRSVERRGVVPNRSASFLCQPSRGVARTVSPTVRGAIRAREGRANARSFAAVSPNNKNARRYIRAAESPRRPIVCCKPESSRQGTGVSP